MKNQKDYEAIIEKENLLHKEMIDQAVDKIAEMQVFEDKERGGFEKKLSTEEVEQNFKEKAREVIQNEEVRLHILKGADIIVDNIHDTTRKEEIRRELREAGKKYEELLSTEMPIRLKDLLEGEEDPDNPSNESQKEEQQAPVENVSPLFETIGISWETMAIMYDVGTDLFNDGRVEEALSSFYFLSTLSGDSHEIWFNLGLCCCRMEKWSEAIPAFKVASEAEKMKLSSLLHLADCYTNLNMQIEARSQLDTAMDILENLDEENDEKETIRKFIDEKMKKI